MAPRRFKKRSRRLRNRAKNSKPVTRADKRLSRRISKLEKGIEMKYLDQVLDAGPTTTGATFNVLANMADGNNYNERIGNKVTSKGILLNYRIYQDPLETAPNQVRIILFWDKQFNGGLGGSLFTGTSPTAADMSAALIDNRAGMVTTIAPYNQNTRQRYKILYDRVHNLTIYDSGAGTVHVGKKFIPLHNAIVNYADNTETNDDLASRTILVAVYSSLGVQASLNLNLTTRYFYTDA